MGYPRQVKVAARKMKNPIQLGKKGEATVFPLALP